MLFTMATFSASASTADSGIAPCFNNTAVISTSFDIDSDGQAEVYVSYTGYPDICTGATITIKLQKRHLGFIWTDVDINWPNNTLTVSVSGDRYTTVRSWNLTSKGTYRAVITVTVYGTGGEADHIEDKFVDEY